MNRQRSKGHIVLIMYLTCMYSTIKVFSTQCWLQNIDNKYQVALIDGLRSIVQFLKPNACPTCSIPGKFDEIKIKSILNVSTEYN
jgi:hypothetical protein